jgi:predicted TIM-barrel fold metal-dependent hydrolase
MKIIDFHTHIYPEKIAGKAVENIGDFYGISMSGEGTSESLIKEGSKCGVTNYVVHSVAVTAATVTAINNFISAECMEHSEFYGFGTMHVDFEDKIGEAKRITELGLRGIKIHPDTQKYNMDDERMLELYDYIREMKIPLLIHTGDYRYDYSHPRRLKNILKQFPGIITIGAHFGGWSVFDLAYELLGEENCYVDTSSSLWMLGAKRAQELIRMYGANRVLFGSDFPMWKAKDELEIINNMNLTDDEKELIFYKNAEKILRINEV